MDCQQPERRQRTELPRDRRLLVAQLTGAELCALGLPDDRRCGIERRQARLWSVLYGAFRPRRRNLRRGDDGQFLTDWYDSLLLLPVLGIVVLSMTDGMLTLNLLAAGARELNVVMAWLIESDPAAFAAIKMALTCTGVVVLAVCGRLRLFGGFRVVHLLFGFLYGYVGLIGYQLVLLSLVA